MNIHILYIFLIKVSNEPVRLQTLQSTLEQHLSCILEDTRDREESLNFVRETIQFEPNG